MRRRQQQWLLMLPPEPGLADVQSSRADRHVPAPKVVFKACSGFGRGGAGKEHNTSMFVCPGRGAARLCSRNANATAQGGQADGTLPPSPNNRACSAFFVCHNSACMPPWLHLDRAYLLRNFLGRRCCRRCRHRCRGACLLRLPAGWQPPWTGLQGGRTVHSHRPRQACPHPPAHHPRAGVLRTARAGAPRCRTPPPVHCRQSPPCRCCTQLGSLARPDNVGLGAAPQGDEGSLQCDRDCREVAFDAWLGLSGST